MIGYEWTVYASSSNDPIIACGITDDPTQAVRVVEFILRTLDRAGWGMLTRVVVSSGAMRPNMLDNWPPAGEIEICRRARDGGFSWMPFDSQDDKAVGLGSVSEYR
jgi:hypothetical protein